MDRFYMDETACIRGHSYTSIFADDNHRIVFATDGNDSSTVRRFMEHQESHGGKADNIKFICCDMGKGFQSGIANEFPDAVVTYDRFHVMEHMSMAVDRSRRHEWNFLRENGRLKEATDLKGQRFPLLRNHGNLTDRQQNAVDAISELNSDIGTVYLLKESLGDTWGFESIYDAANHMIAWLLTAVRTGIGYLGDIIKPVDNHFNDILNRFNSGMTNGVMEVSIPLSKPLRGVSEDTVIGAISGRYAIFAVQDCVEIGRYVLIFMERTGCPRPKGR